MMTPDIRPRPSPGSRIYSKEETPPPNLGFTQRVGVELPTRDEFEARTYVILFFSAWVQDCSDG